MPWFQLFYEWFSVIISRSRSVTAWFLRLVTKSPDVRQCSTMFDNVRRYSLLILPSSSLPEPWFGNVRQCSNMFDTVRQCSTLLFPLPLLFLSTWTMVRKRSTMFDHVRHCWTMFDHVRHFSTMFDNVRHSSFLFLSSSSLPEPWFGERGRGEEEEREMSNIVGHCRTWSNIVEH